GLGEVFGHLHQRESIGDVDVSNLAAREAGLSRDGADKVLGADARGASRADVETGHEAATAFSTRAVVARSPVASSSPGTFLLGSAGGLVAVELDLGNLVFLMVLGTVGLMEQFDGAHGNVHEVELGGQ